MDKLRPGLYATAVKWYQVPVGLGCVARLPITVFDLRFVPPNSELFPALPVAGLHTIEHIGREFFRTEAQWNDRVDYFGMMGSRTGFCLQLVGELTPNGIADESFRLKTVRELVMQMCWTIMSWQGEIPGVTPEKCGNYRDHNLLTAKKIAHNYYILLSQTPKELGYDPFIYPK